MRKISVTFLFLCFVTFYSQAQSGEIKGRVFDEMEKLPIPGAHVYVEIAGEKQGNVTSTDGRFTIKPLNPGTYNVYATFLGFQTALITEVVVKPDKITSMKDIYLKEGIEMIDIVIRYVPDLMDAEEPSKMSVLSAQIEKMPNKTNMPMVLRSLSSEVQVSDDGKEIHFRGARANTSAFFIDGVKQSNMDNTMPSRAIGSVTVYAGGIPAKYGDLTGGVVVIESKSYFDYLNEYKARESRK
ncbi:MAG: carboxypeptidase regulatory-like domain-containing protein [Bacteroidales bacterium]|nr:carboxypeptidase regulatory-like domain-containing protein [Bacteroidales bacterium]MCF8458089.1 carboxypeptidase regulatory-like domain-containing protein [Bacteroidales bacterium]